MKKRIAILSLVAMFFAVTATSAATKAPEEKAKTEVKCDKKADAKCDKKADAKCCEKKSDATCCKKATEEKACCKKDGAKKAEVKK